MYIHTVADSLTFQVYLSQIYATWLFILLYIYELIYCTISLCDIWISLICLKRRWLYSWKEIRVKYSKLPKTLISSKQLCNLDNCFLLSSYDLFSMYIKLINIIYIKLIIQNVELCKERQLIHYRNLCRCVFSGMTKNLMYLWPQSPGVGAVYWGKEDTSVHLIYWLLLITESR